MLDIHANKIIANKFVGEFENNNDGISIGMIIPFASNKEIPNGFLLCNGASIRKDTYIDLFNVISTTYGSVDEEHFNLPNLNGKFLEGSDTSGIYKETGLPNIEGTFPTTVFNGNYDERRISGAFVFDSKTTYPSGNGLAYNSGSVGKSYFNASLSNPIYGNSDTVQPPSLTVRYIIKAFNGISSSTTTDIEVTQLANDLADKANRSLTNTVDNVDFVVESYNDEEENWYRLYKSGWVEQGGILPTGEEKTFTFIKPYANTYYAITRNTPSYSTGALSALNSMACTLTPTSFKYSNSIQNSTFYACGMGARE